MSSVPPRPRPRGLAWRARLSDTVGSAVERFRWYGPGRVAAGAAGGVAFGLVVWWSLTPPEVPAAPEPALHADVAPSAPGPPSGTAFPLVGATTTLDTIVVHVAGAVRTPGVVRLGSGARVDDAVRAAGGPTADAEPDLVNLAAPVADGDRIHVPRVGEVARDTVAPAGVPPGGAGVAGAPGAASSVDVNRADVAALTALPGIGPVTAAAIVDERDRNGPFRDVDDLRRVRGIGPAKVEALRESVRT